MYFTYYKNRIFTLLFLTAMFSGVASVTQAKTIDTDLPSLLEHARQLLENDELYESKRIVEEAMKKYPQHEGVQELMAEIIEKEIALYMEVEENKVVEEYSDEEMRAAVKTWLERANGLLDVGQFHQALLAAEKVFQYGADNIEATRVIDEIKKKAYKAGKGESLILKRMYDNEVQVRTDTYVEQARNWMREGRRGSARLALEKILLLDPTHSEAVKMYKELKSSPALTTA